MSIGKYLNKNKIGALILIIVIIIAFGFGGFGGGFLSNNQNNIAKINKTNVTTKDLINYINGSGISQKAIQENLDDNIIEELLSSLVSTTLLNLEIKDFGIQFSENSLSQKIKLNKNFINENGIFQRIKYEKFLLENNISAPFFEKRLKDRELQKKLFDYIGAGTVSPKFLVTKLFKNENRKLEINFIDLETFYKNDNKINDKDLLQFIDENQEILMIEYINFRYSKINPLSLIGINEFNQEFFDKIDEIENDILNGIDFDSIISKFDLKIKAIDNYSHSGEDNSIENKVYKKRNTKTDIFESGENFIIYNIEDIQNKKPDIKNLQTKNEILKLVNQKNKFDYNRKLLEKIRNEKFTEKDFLELGKNKIQSLILNSVKDNKKFEINSVQMLYSLPINTLTLINDEQDKIYLAQVKSYKDIELDKNNDNYKSFINKENTRIKNSILKSYDLFLNLKYNVNINQVAINNVKNLFQ
ncbi:SurA N-terminal domain-containing protein [Candidatus Pelagibacter communis]|uniref:SurA N-terminal domain-containing protein n=1 Tax=Pelagibacter ubique TaxID=198252 RepID=UPI00094BEEC6|nr:SurA N-terminal domain-containing protein [Candidatus Pelagibacter ubique]